MNTITNRIIKKTFLVITLFVVNYSFGQNVYTQPQISYKNGALVETYSSDNLQISVSASIEKVFNNAKEIFYNIIVTPKSDNITLVVNNIKAYQIDKNKEKEIKLYDYQSYKAKLKRNILLWGPNQNESKTITTNIQSQTSGISDQNKYITGTVNDNETTSTTSLRANENSKTNYNQNTNVKVTTTITEPNPIFYETNKNAELFAEGYLRSNTVNIGDVINGFVVSKLSNSKHIKLTIPINNDVYSFSFEF